ncbi:hypothetical protein D9615_008904 [Tricholomella constricta]|uniref:RING-type domain-containing protein n=1 Tax=Tricholomella constricta TaxID=117010 RepID=A0A8H5GZU5_9AGAR|nr:hypothetical protein D9615_008904 [Tricholomella constricta]
MLTLTPGSACDVCAEEYGAQCHPHSIPCGHVLCASCCSTIVEKTPSRLAPVCPFCRETFTGDSIRLIRMDFNSSGWSTPRRMPQHPIESSQADFAEMWARKTERLLLSEGCSRTRLEARRLEDKVAKVAAKKCSVEEVSTLHRELEDWLTSDVKDDQTSLHLSAALLRAILMNHLAHSEAMHEIFIDGPHLLFVRQRQQYSQKAQDYHTVCIELNRLKGSLGIPPDSRQSATSPTPPSTSPVPPYSPTTQSPLSRFNSVHQSSSFEDSNTRSSLEDSNTCSPQDPNTWASPGQVSDTVRTVPNTVYTVVHPRAANDAHDDTCPQLPADNNTGATSHPSQAPQVVDSVTPQNDALKFGREG